MIETMTGSEVLFEEVQRPRWATASAIFAVAYGIFLLAFSIWSLSAGHGFHFGNVFSALVILAALAASACRLRTRVTDDQLELERRWGWGHTIELDSVRSVREAEYFRAIDGGWGVRDGRCVILTYGDGEVLYIGSARSKELCEVIRSRMPSTTVAPARSA